MHGILLANLGTPDAPTTSALRRYLKEFLWDPRVIELSRPLWWLILNGIVLNTRPQKSAHAYRNIWAKGGSPLLVVSRAQARSLAKALEKSSGAAKNFKISIGMRYGKPSIRDGLEELRSAGCRRLTLLPLYPQYAGATVGSTFDAVAEVLQGWRWVPEFRFINNYHDHPLYIAALAKSIEDFWRQHGRPDTLLFSYHGLPQRYVDAGDPYQTQCNRTTELVVAELGLKRQEWQICFQSRFGKEPWLQPYADESLRTLAASGIKKLHMIAPGFSVDCLETLEEIDMQYRELFLQQAQPRGGGADFHYIPALNNRPEQVALLAALVNHDVVS